MSLSIIRVFATTRTHLHEEIKRKLTNYLHSTGITAAFRNTKFFLCFNSKI